MDEAQLLCCRCEYEVGVGHRKKPQTALCALHPSLAGKAPGAYGYLGIPHLIISGQLQIIGVNEGIYPVFLIACHKKIDKGQQTCESQSETADDLQLEP